LKYGSQDEGSRGREPGGWRGNAASLVVPAYILLLPFQGLGPPVLGHRLTAADCVLFTGAMLVSATWLQHRKEGKRYFDPAFALLGLALAGFLLAAIASIAASPRPAVGLIAMVPYVHALLAILTFGRLLSNSGPVAEVNISRALNLSLGVTSLAALIPMGWIPKWDVMAYETGGYQIFLKYRFFLDSPNQLSVLIVVFFALITVFRVHGKGLGKWQDVLSPALFTNVILLSGSRITPLSGLILVLVYWAVLAREALVERNQSLALKYGRLLFSISLAAAVIAVQIDGPRTMTVYRSISGLRSLAGKLTPASVDVGAKILWYEPVEEASSYRDNLHVRALECVQDEPMLGAGLGQCRARGRGPEVHNSVLGAVAEMGLVGAFALALLLGTIITLVIRAATSLFELICSLGLLLAALLPHWVHYLMRERWYWLFFIFLAWLASASKTRPAPNRDSIP
jgi:hypothetical protein